MAAPFHWPEEDALEAIRLKQEGMTWRQVGLMFGKSKSAAQAAVRRYLGYKMDPHYNTPDGPPIGMEQTEMSDRANAKSGSASLRLAINSLLERMPDRAVREILCPQAKAIPGTERVHKTASIERMAA